MDGAKWIVTNDWSYRNDNGVENKFYRTREAARKAFNEFKHDAIEAAKEEYSLTEAEAKKENDVEVITDEVTGKFYCPEYGCEVTDRDGYFSIYQDGAYAVDHQTITLKEIVTED